MVQLKCSGEQLGCRRCSTLGTTCEYGISYYGKKTKHMKRTSDPRNAVTRGVRSQRSEPLPGATSVPVKESQLSAADNNHTPDEHTPEERTAVSPWSPTVENEGSDLSWLGDASGFLSTETFDVNGGQVTLSPEGDSTRQTSLTMHELENVAHFWDTEFSLGNTVVSWSR